MITGNMSAAALCGTGFSLSTIPHKTSPATAGATMIFAASAAPRARPASSGAARRKSRSAPVRMKNTAAWSMNAEPAGASTTGAAA